MDNLLIKTHIYDAVKALDPGVKVSKGWFAALNEHVQRVIAANVEATKAGGCVTLKSFVAAVARQAAGEETSAPVVESTNESKYRMVAVGQKMRRVTTAYKVSINTKPATDDNASKVRACFINGTLTVHTSLKDKPLTAMLEQLVWRRLNEAGIEDLNSVKIVDVEG